MIIHRYKDGSEGYEYEVGDVVRIKDVIPYDAWLRRAIGRIGPIERIKPYNRQDPSYHTAELFVRDLPDWGPSQCYPWMVEPTAETPVTAVIEIA